MTDINGSSYVDSLRWQKETVEVSDDSTQGQSLSQEDFFALLTTQLAAQDPTNPTDNNQMISQMTEFTSAEGISDLSTKFDEFNSSFGEFMTGMQAQQTSNKALQASSMVGREVLVASEEAPLFQFGEDVYGMAGQLMFDTAMNDIKLEMRNESGKLVATLDVGAATEGPLNFTWDGLDNDGNQLPTGMYKLSATGIDANSGLRTDLATGSYSRVDSVRFGSGNELSMNLRGLGSFSMDDILEVAP